MKVSQQGIALIKSFEGFRSCPYQDAVGVWTIGYGETHGVNAHTPCISENDAAAQLQRRVNRDYAPAVDQLHLKLNQNQYDALCSVVYNLGPGVLDRGRSLGDALRSGNMRAAADAILLYDKAGSPPRALAGLTRRRQAERQLFLRPDKPTPEQLKAWRRRLNKTQTRIAKLRARARKLRRKIGGK
jgi:lysozyme